MNVGFTGTQLGMRKRQLVTFMAILRGLEPPIQFHHGMCIGADEDAHHAAVGRCLAIIGHPPVDQKKMMQLPDLLEFSEILPPLPYLHRNHAIVDAVELLIAAPFLQMQEVLRSGTWATIRYARKKGRQTVILWPDGTATWENHDERLQAG